MSMSFGGSGGYGPTGSRNFSKATGYNVAQLGTQGPRSQALVDALLGSLGGSGGLQSGIGHLSKLASGDQSYFGQLEAPALRQFGQLQDALASRFSNEGLGARHGSGFANTMNSQAIDLAERLQGQRLGYQNQAIQQLQQLLGSLIGADTRENFVLPKQKSMWQELLLGLSSGIGPGLGLLGRR